MHLKNTIQSLFWGIIAAGMSLIFQLFTISLLISPHQSTEVNRAFLGSLILLIIYAFSEEAFKYFIAAKKIIPLSYGRSAIWNGWMAGIGFSLVEGFIIYQKNIYEKIDFQILEIFKTAPLHILTFGALGYFLTISEKRGLNLGILAFNFIAHFIYNYSIIYLDYYSSYITFLVLSTLLVINVYGLIIVNKKRLFSK